MFKFFVFIFILAILGGIYETFVDDKDENEDEQTPSITTVKHSKKDK